MLTRVKSYRFKHDPLPAKRKIFREIDHVKVQAEMKIARMWQETLTNQARTATEKAIKSHFISKDGDRSTKPHVATNARPFLLTRSQQIYLVTTTCWGPR